jgi:hypothetical protein
MAYPITKDATKAMIAPKIPGISVVKIMVVIQPVTTDSTNFLNCTFNPRFSEEYCRPEI